MPTLLARLRLFFLLLLVMGGVGWLWWKGYGWSRDMRQRLVSTKVELAQRQNSLTLVEEERQKLSDAYEALKTRWTESDKELQTLTHTSKQMTTELATLSTERSDFAHRLEASSNEQRLLQEQIAALQQEVASTASDRTALQSQVHAAAIRSLSPNELQQLTDALAQQHSAEDQRKEQLAELSHAYEELATRSADSAPASTASSSYRARVDGADATRTLPTGLNSQQAARLYRNLGESYLATTQYPKSAEAFERSLQWEDNPAVHGKLAFLYSRFVHNREKAAYHAARAPAGRPLVVTALGSTAKEQGYPRSGWQLIWQWLTQ